MPPVTDLRDTRVLIPRARRALEGLSAEGSATSTYSDDQVNGAVADAIARVLLYSGDLLGHTLEVVERDDYYMAPIAWRTSGELTEQEQVLIATQAALDHVYTSLVETKTSQTIRNEGQEWSYSISAGALTERLKGLREDRDRALEVIASQNQIDEDWISFVQARDARVSAIIEPYVDGNDTGGQQLDPRGFI